MCANIKIKQATIDESNIQHVLYQIKELYGNDSNINQIRLFIYAIELNSQT